MNRNPTRQFDPNVLAALHRTGRVWRGVIVRLPAKNGGKPQLLAHREFSPAENSRLASWIDEHDAGRISVVLHASTVICRTCPLPDAPHDQLGPALRLQAEAHLFGIAPPHRMGMAVLEAAPGETSRSGIVLAWPEHRPGNGDAPDAHRPPLRDDQLAGREIRYTPDVASLASLLNGFRPTQPLAWVDREDGSLALAVTHANGAVFRGLREDASDAQAWKASVGSVLAETCLSVGHTGAFIESLVNSMRERIADIGEGDSRLLAPPEVIQGAKDRLENAPGDEKWWRSYGIAAGVALARSSDLAPLTELRESVPVKRATSLDRAVTALASRTAAVSAVLACIAVLMFGPLVVNGARLAILSTKYPETQLREQLAEVRAINNQLVVYRELDRNSWSMTKILSDIASNTPQGIELEHIRVASTRNFNVQGRVIPHGGLTATELVGVMRQNLDECGIFRDTSLQWRDPDAFGHYQFTLSASIARPYRMHEYPEDLDFALKSLRERMFGPPPSTLASATGATGVPAATTEARGEDLNAVAEVLTEVVTGMRDPNADDIERIRASAETYEDDGTWEEQGYPSHEEWVAERTGSRPDIRGQFPGRTMGGGREGDEFSVDRRSEAAGLSPDDVAPPPLSKEQIDAMSEAEVRDNLTRIAQARGRANARQDTELQERLKQEMTWLMERLRNLR